MAYAALHSLVHLATPFLIAFIFNLNFENFLIVFFANFLIDLDHLYYFKKYGLKHWIDTILKFSEAKKYPLHNLYLLMACFIGSLLLFFTQYFKIGLVFLSIFLHMLWDLFEDIVIFKMGIKHWLI
ncbi:MAG: hypothetical protein QXQ18_01765 [Candidatus Aenigmatarchaeota archaeon]